MRCGSSGRSGHAERTEGTSHRLAGRTPAPLLPWLRLAAAEGHTARPGRGQGAPARPGDAASALRAAAQHAGAPAANRDVSSAGGGRCCLLAEGFVHLSRRNTVPLRLTRAIKIPRPRIEARARHNPRSPASHGLLNKPAQCSRPRAPGTRTAAQRTAYGRLVTTSSYGPVHPSS